MKISGGVNVTPRITDPALAGGKWSASLPSHITLGPLGEEPQYLLDRRLGGSRTSLDNANKEKSLFLLGLELQPISHPACNQLLC
jgi:hypothetical protein